MLRDIFLKGRIIEYDGTREVYNPLNAIKMENRLIEPLSEMMHQGVCLDPLQWKEIAQEKKRLYYEKIEWLNNWVVDNHPEFGGAIDMFTNKATCMVKWSSPKQVQSLFNKLGLTVRARSKFTGKVEDTVGAKELLKALPNEYKAKFFESKFPDDIVEGKDLVLAYLLVKKLQQLHTTYGEQFLNYLHPITGRIHCNIRQYLHTSRMAAVRPNMLAVPRGKEYRSCFIAPKGMKVWACDYSSWIGMIIVHRECTTIIII